jgi:hypothetical protein
VVPACTWQAEWKCVVPYVRAGGNVDARDTGCGLRRPDARRALGRALWFIVYPMEMEDLINVHDGSISHGENYLYAL